MPFDRLRMPGAPTMPLSANADGPAQDLLDSKIVTFPPAPYDKVKKNNGSLNFHVMFF
jgi:hypothetical protein